MRVRFVVAHSLMRVRIVVALLACCCAALTACTAAAPKGPDANVTAPAVGRPPTPVSAQAALSSEAFTPFADIGAAPDDGLALGDTYAALHTACMNDAGYGQYANSTPFFVRANRGLGFAQPQGPWGYVGVSLAAQYGFNPPADGPDEGDSPLTADSLPAEAQAAAGKCFNIVQAFNDAQFATSLAGIETMNNEISNDVVQDAAFKRATRAWSACMSRNGYSTPDANTFWQQAAPRPAIVGPNPSPSPGASNPAAPPAPTEAQIASAVTDAQCTLSTDLAGIYFAVQASYEQQFVSANQQALSVAVRHFKADYASELRKLPALLRTESAKLNLPFFGKNGRPGRAVKPGGTPSKSRKSQ